MPRHESAILSCFVYLVGKSYKRSWIGKKLLVLSWLIGHNSVFRPRVERGWLCRIFINSISNRFLRASKRNCRSLSLILITWSIPMHQEQHYFMFLNWCFSDFVVCCFGKNCRIILVTQLPTAVGSRLKIKLFIRFFSLALHTPCTRCFRDIGFKKTRVCSREIFFYLCIGWCSIFKNRYLWSSANWKNPDQECRTRTFAFKSFAVLSISRWVFRDSETQSKRAWERILR